MFEHIKKIDGTLITKILEAIIYELNFEKKKILHLQMSELLSLKEFKLLEKIKYKNIKSDAVTKIFFEQEDKFDLIFADIPFGIKQLGERSISLSILDHLEPKGICCVMMPNFYKTFKSIQGKSYLNEIKSKGFHILSVLNLPEDFLIPHSSIQSTLVFFIHDNGVEQSHFQTYKDSDYAGTYAGITSWRMSLIYDVEKRQSYIENGFELPYQEEDLAIKWDPELLEGVEYKISDFVGFDHWKELRQIEKLDTEYGGYTSIALSELAIINSTKDEFKDDKDAIYIPAIGNTEVIDWLPLKNSKKKPHNYFQIIINDNRIKKEYLLNYLNSSLGQKFIKLEFLKNDSTISRLKKIDILKLQIHLPNLGVQDEIIRNVNKLNKVKELLIDIESSFATKPISSTEQLNKLDQIYKSSMELSESEIYFDEILKGESTSREFKETFALDVKIKKRGDHIVFSCVKTIAGFLNGNGGSLYIGVADNSDITGIEKEVGTKKLFKSTDKYQLAIKDTLKKRISTSSLNNVNFKLIKIRGKKILHIKCLKSDHQVFIDNKDTYLRVGPSTELLEGPDLVNFSKERFN